MLRTLSPLESTHIAINEFPFDLHVLSTPPAFVLSQNQTLRKKINQTCPELLRDAPLTPFGAIADPTDSTLSTPSGLPD